MPMLLPPEVEPNRKPLIIGFVVVVLLIIVGFTVWYLNVYVNQHVAQQQATSIQTKLLGPVNQAAGESVQADVRNAVITVQNYVNINGIPANYAVIPLNKSSDKETLTITGAGSNFQIVGTYTPSGFTYTYDSTTGSYK